MMRGHHDPDEYGQAQQADDHVQRDGGSDVPDRVQDDRPEVGADRREGTEAGTSSGTPEPDGGNPERRRTADDCYSMRT